MSTRVVSTRLHTVSLSRYVHELLQAPHNGTLLATFGRSCYLDLSGHIVALVLPDLLDGPLNLVVESDTDFRFANLPVRETVKSSNAGILIGNAVEITVGEAPIWEPQLAQWGRSDLSTVRTSMNFVQKILLGEAPEGSFATYLTDPTALSMRARSGLGLLEQALRRRSPVSAAEAAQQLAGLGGGLTPSGDDVLVGTLLALSVIHHEDLRELRNAIIAEVRGRTTRISETYLEAAARGEAGEAWHRLIRVLPSQDRAAIVVAARRVMAFGETSGSDMLAGFTLAISTLIS
ncbi:MAG: DUF2877 domain-containing protein [bacterium]